MSWAVVETPDLIIGVFNGDPDYQFEDISAAARQSDGDFVVADMGSRTVRLFGRDGVFRKTLGGPGSGPGEFTRPTQVIIGSVDSIFVWDDATSRVTRFDATGAFVGIQSFSRERLAKGAGPPFYPASAKLLATGELLVRLVEKSSDLPNESRFRNQSGLLRVSPDLSAIELVARFADMEQVLVDSPWGRIPMTPPLSPTTQVAVSSRGGTACFGDQVVTEVHCLEADGSETVARWLTDPMSVAGNDPAIAAWRAATLEGLEMKLSHDEALRLVDAVPIPLRRPSFAGLSIDVNGDLWVERGPANVDGQAAVEYLVFHGSGALMGTVHMPPIDVLEIGDDYVLGVHRDELDVQYVHLLAIKKPKSTAF